MTYLVNNKERKVEKRVEFYENTVSSEFTANNASITLRNGYGLALIKNYCERERPELPIDAVRNQLVEILKHNETSIIIGETGSGKSTQIPQLCLEAGLDKLGKIGITQPRRVAALALAKRVADEQGTDIGKEVGYKYRFNNETSTETKIVFLTDGILLREALFDSFLNDYSTIIIDEVHERSLHTDIVLYLVRMIQRQRQELGEMNPLRIIVMSATIESKKISEYFGKAPVYYIEGRTYPVELFYANSLSINSDDFVYNAVSTVLDLNESEPMDHDFLVFLTGQEEIEKARKMIYDEQKNTTTRKILPIGLYSAQAQHLQHKAFDQAPFGTRKVIFSTNISETSLTIPGIRIVIDTGKVKQKTFTAQKRIEVLRVNNISKAQAIQRAGRAGREAPGKCFRLYSDKDYEKFDEMPTPEILRSNLSGVLLELTKMGMSSITSLKLLDKPSTDFIDSAIVDLENMNAIKVKKKIVKGKVKKHVELTSLGVKLAEFPVDPAFARILIAAEKLNCLEEALTVVAFISSEDVTVPVAGTSRDQENISAQKFNTNEGDHEWYNKNGLNERRLNNVAKARKQLREICTGQKMKIESCGQNTTSLRQAIAHGLFMNACEYNPSNGLFKLISQPGTLVKIHPSSCLSRTRPTTIVFTELVKTTDLFARTICLVDAEWIKNALDKENGLLSKY